MTPTHHLDALRIAVASRNWVLVDLVIAGMDAESQNRVEAHEPVAHDPRCVVYQHGICTCALFQEQTESFTESQVAEELGVTLPPATQWDSYEPCTKPSCLADTGQPCVSGGYAPTGVLPGDALDEPHKSRNLIRQNKDQECEVLGEGTHESPPVPTPPHSTPHCTVPDCDLCEKDKELDHPADCKCVNPECLMRAVKEADQVVNVIDDPYSKSHVTIGKSTDSCANCHDPKDCTRGPGCACCNNKAVKEPDRYLCCKHCRHDFPRLGPVHLKPCNHVGCAQYATAAKPVEKPKLCIRSNPCKYPDHSAVASCIVEEKQVTYPHCEHCPRATKMGINYGECMFTEHVAPCVHCQEGK